MHLELQGATLEKYCFNKKCWLLFLKMVYRVKICSFLTTVSYEGQKCKQVIKIYFISNYTITTVTTA